MTDNKQYPELPTHFMLVQESFHDEVYLYTADQMRAYVDADRAMRAAQAAPAYVNSTPELHVGDSAFEDWYSGYNPAHKGDKQRARDAYAAGMGDPLVVAAPAAAAQGDALVQALIGAQRAINSMKVEAETAAQGDEQMMLDACEQISNEGLEASLAIQAALSTVAQPPADGALNTPDQLQAIIAESVREAVAAATAKQRVNATDLAAELGVSVPTLARMEKDGRLPPREGRYWDRKALDKWQRDRA